MNSTKLSRRPALLAVSMVLLVGWMHPVFAAPREVLPAGTVIPVRLEEPLSSKSSRPGDKFTVTVRPGPESAGLPAGTRVRGVVREALPAGDGDPGVLDLEFRSLVFPNGLSRPIDASLYSLDAKDLKRTESGRLIATSNKAKDRLKFIGIGAGAGLLISVLTKGDTLRDILLGAGAGYLYNELKKEKPGDVNLRSGTEFGLRLDREFAFDVGGQGSSRSSDRSGEERNEHRYEDVRTVGTEKANGATDRLADDIGVLIDDREVRFSGAKPFQRAGVTLIPLAAVAREANFDYQYDAARKMIIARNGTLRMGMGSRIALSNGQRYRMNGMAEMRNGTLYVPPQFIALAISGSVYWDAPSRTVVFTTHENL